MYAQIIDNRIEATGGLPASARRLDTGDWVMGLDTAPPDLRAATGWVEVTDTPRPADTATTTHDYSVELVDGTPTVVWTPRPKTTDEQAAETQQTNQRSIEDRLRSDLDGAQAIIDTPAVNIVGTTVAEVRSSTQTVMRDLQRQIKDQARMNKRLIRLGLRAFDTAD